MAALADDWLRTPTCFEYSLSVTYSAYIDFADPDGVAPRLRHAFGAARSHLIAWRHQDVRAILDTVQEQAESGRWCLGYVRYEAAPAFDPAFLTQDADGPLVWFAVYDEAHPWPAAVAEAPSSSPWQMIWDEGLSRAGFDRACERVSRAIAAGDLYQVNFTAPLRGRWRGLAAPEALFAALQRAQPGGYTLYLDTGPEKILSVSPELFFDWHAPRLLTRPMKGTAARGATPAEDEAHRVALASSPKERAENLMIVDLLRNDLSRLAEPFSVQVPHLFQTQRLATVWQMTSDIQARTRQGCTLYDVFSALFPCGSVTGAPKVSAMRMIRALEAHPRGIYCGALGVVQPGGRATFNVPIRTVVLGDRQACCGIGSGLVADSVPDAEWNEWRNKRTFLERACQPFDLLETFGLYDGQSPLLPNHLRRLGAAAEHFAYPFDLPKIRSCLARLFEQHPWGQWRIRLSLNAYGQPHASALPLQTEQSVGPVALKLADEAFAAAASEFVRFKTTRREHYASFAPAEGVFDTLLWNSAGEVTEGTRCNVAFRRHGQWWTPPLRCGLLPGIGREHWLQNGRIREAVLHVKDLSDVEDFAVFNSLRGWLPARLLSH